MGAGPRLLKSLHRWTFCTRLNLVRAWRLARGLCATRQACRPKWMGIRVKSRVAGIVVAGIVGLVCLWTLLVGLSGGGRSLVAALVASALMVGVLLVFLRFAHRTALAVVAVGVAVLISPWVFGLANNALQGWHDHTMYWGRYYNLSKSSADAQDQAHAVGAAGLVTGSTLILPPSYQSQGAPTVLVVRGNTGYRVYSLVGGP
jgi:hypothetical protein